MKHPNAHLTRTHYLGAISYFWLCVAAFAGAMEIEVSDSTIPLAELGVQGENLVMLRDSRTALLVSNRDQRLVQVDLLEPKVLNDVGYEQSDFPVSFTDVAVGSHGRFVYLVGTWSPLSQGILARLELGSMKMRIVRFSERFGNPSVAVSRADQVFISNVVSGTITEVGGYLFEELDGMVVGLQDVGRSIFLKQGPPNDIGVSANGRLLVVSHALDTRLSLVDSEFAEVIDDFGPDKLLRYPLPMVVTTATDSQRSKFEGEGPRTAVVVADLEGDVLVTANVNEEFGSFIRVESAALELDTSQVNAFEFSPLIIAASDNQELIMVGSRIHEEAMIRGPFGARVVTLPAPPGDLDVSPDGTTVAILDVEGLALRVIRNPFEWAAQTGMKRGRDQIREAQMLLSELKFPVGSVDGVDGPATHRAVRAFQESADLEPSGVIDEPTLQRLRSVASEHPSREALLATPDGTATVLNQCEVVSEKARCPNEFATRMILQQSIGKLEASTSEVICAAPEDAQRRVQIDIYYPTRHPLDYQCTRFHSCAYIRFQKFYAYYDICQQTREQRSRKTDR